ncbi:nucleotidyltransferase domain-containing protein [Halomonas urumqiensis]|uniref:DNA polymerase III subunit beta n=1 Tax=Halomonas urumqiensis TaxID=1684789 RepID=A0A2N7UCE4_9GAMM|nr:nucleotidyltransferase domain-containing protein [Halomonas urumqiensis]PMR78116.1 DNA polymerase III subunit beta [Halomonas urumqiensis]PTB03267.1 nucleotidyltransferase domain-containing protein [Halomonas urumqiensis]GHE20574.1 hypothetical protein GCM10017767_10950 [Halomonas urumqiensis]
MRLTEIQRQRIQRIVAEELGPNTQVKLFGSRLDDDAKGGDIDLLIELDREVEHPAQISAKISVKIMRAMHGRKVDILLNAPNLEQLDIHRIASHQGVKLFDEEQYH